MESRTHDSVDVWDWPVRVIHWGMVLAVVVLFISVNLGWMQLHFYAGYGLSALILFRLIWLFVGTRYARLTGFNLSITGFFGQLNALITGRALPFLGHNPAGAVMVLVLLLVLSLQIASGLFYTDDVFWFGPFFFDSPDWAQNAAAWLHPRLPPLVLLLILTHILAVIYHKLRFREPLVSAMIHGRKPAADAGDGREPVNRVWFVLSLIAALGWLGWLLTLEI